MSHVLIYEISALLFAFFLAWGIGANDVANAMGTSVVAGVLSLRQALLVAAIFESLGALSAGGGVTSTIRGHIFDASSLLHNPHYFILGMLAAMLAAATWLLVASLRGWPVSTTQTLIGGVLGVGLAHGRHYLNTRVITNILISWAITVPIGAALTLFYFWLMRLVT